MKLVRNEENAPGATNSSYSSSPPPTIPSPIESTLFVKGTKSVKKHF
jgi:hypothetical protein